MEFLEMAVRQPLQHQFPALLRAEVSDHGTLAAVGGMEIGGREMRGAGAAMPLRLTCPFQIVRRPLAAHG